MSGRSACVGIDSVQTDAWCKIGQFSFSVEIEPGVVVAAQIMQVGQSSVNSSHGNSTFFGRTYRFPSLGHVT